MSLLWGSSGSSLAHISQFTKLRISIQRQKNDPIKFPEHGRWHVLQREAIQPEELAESYTNWELIREVANLHGMKLPTLGPECIYFTIRSHSSQITHFRLEGLGHRLTPSWVCPNIATLKILSQKGTWKPCKAAPSRGCSLQFKVLSQSCHTMGENFLDRRFDLLSDVCLAARALGHPTIGLNSAHIRQCLQLHYFIPNSGGV